MSGSNGKENLGLMEDTESTYANINDGLPSEEYMPMQGAFSKQRDKDYLDIDDASIEMQNITSGITCDSDTATYAMVDSDSTTPIICIPNEEDNVYASMIETPTTPPKGSPPKSKKKADKKAARSHAYDSASLPHTPAPYNKLKPRNANLSVNTSNSQDQYAYADPDFGPIGKSKSLEVLPGRNSAQNSNVNVSISASSSETRLANAEVRQSTNAAKRSGKKTGSNLYESDKQSGNRKQRKVRERSDSSSQNSGTPTPPAERRAVQVKTTTGRRCKTNVAYETRELPPDPESEQTDMDTAKTASLQNTNYYRHAISSPTRWRAFMIIIFFMIVLSLAMISVQAFWLFGGCCKSKLSASSTGKYQMTSTDLLKTKLKYLEAKMNKRFNEISELQRTTKSQQRLIINLQQVLQSYNMTNNLTVMSNNTRKRREIIINKKKIGDFD